MADQGDETSVGKRYTRSGGIRFLSGIILTAVLLPACASAREASPTQSGEDQQAVIARVEAALLPAFIIAGEAPPKPSLVDRMRELNVPGASVAVIHKGRIEWARGWGFADREGKVPVTPETRFQAASISKAVAATAALDLVEEGKLALDVPVNDFLVSWKLPDNGFTAGTPVTLRGLLTHTGGITVHGFNGYAEGEFVPSTADVLAGKGNSEAVVVDVTPGTRWRYSGGGYTVMQLAIEDVTGKPFAQLMQERVLGPLGMEHSTYSQPLPAELASVAAAGYRADGTLVQGRWHTYPEQAAAGLWTTPTDLARWAMAIQRGKASREHPVLDAETIDAMLTEGPLGHGLGPEILARGSAFGHGGSNEGYRCTLRALVQGGEGVAIMTNSDNGGRLAQELLLTIAREYGWDIEPRVLTPVTRTADQLREYEGVWILSSAGIQVELAVTEGKLIAKPSFQPGTEELIPDGQDSFFQRSNGAAVKFIRTQENLVSMNTQGIVFQRK